MIKVISDPFAMYADVMSMLIASEKVGTSCDLWILLKSSFNKSGLISSSFFWYKGQHAAVTGWGPEQFKQNCWFLHSQEL